MLQPGDPVWIRYFGIVSYGTLVHCMPELNMYIVRPDSDGSTRLVTGGIQDILPVTRAGSPNLPPDDEEWDNNSSTCETELMAFGDHQLLSRYRDCGVSLTSLSSPLYIDATERSCSRVSADENPSGGPIASNSGLLSTSPVSFTLSPVGTTIPAHPEHSSHPQLDECTDWTGTKAEMTTGTVCAASHSVPTPTSARITLNRGSSSSHPQLDWSRKASPHHHPNESGLLCPSRVTANVTSTLSSPQRFDTGQSTTTSFGSTVHSPDSTTSDVPAQTDLHSSISGPLASTVDSNSVFADSIGGILQWVLSLVANRQSSTVTEPIHQAAMGTLYEAVQLLLSLAANLQQADLHSPVDTAVTSTISKTDTATANSCGMDALTAALISPGPEFEPSSVTTEESLEPAFQPIPVSMDSSDCLISSNSNVKSMYWEERSKPPNDNPWPSPSPTIPPPRATVRTSPRTDLFERRMEFSRPFHVSNLGLDDSRTHPSAPHLDWNAPDWLRLQGNLPAGSNQTTSSPAPLPTVSPSSSHSVAFSSTHSSGPRPPSLAATLEPGAYGELPVSRSHSIIVPPPPPSLIQPPDLDSGNNNTRVSMVSALNALSQLCQHQSDPLCTCLTELLQKLSSILLVLSGSRTNPIPEAASVEPCDRIPMTHLNLGDVEHTSHGTVSSSARSRLFSTDYSRLPSVLPGSNDCRVSPNESSLRSKLPLGSTHTPFISPQPVGTDKPVALPIHKMDEIRPSAPIKQPLSKRNRTSSTTAFVSLNSSVVSPSHVAFSQPTTHKTYPDVLSDTNRPLLGHLDSHTTKGHNNVQKRCGSVDTHPGTSHSSGSGGMLSSGRSEVKKCRKMYGIEHRDQWCNQCRWKKACRRFPDPAGSKLTVGEVLPGTQLNEFKGTRTTTVRRPGRVENHPMLGVASTASGTTSPVTSVSAQTTAPVTATAAAMRMLPLASADPLIARGSDEYCSRSAPATFSPTLLDAQISPDIDSVPDISKPAPHSPDL